MSIAILADRQGYYQQQENGQKMASPPGPAVTSMVAVIDENPDLTPWLCRFLTTQHKAIAEAEAQIGCVLGKSRFLQQHHQPGLSAEQIKALNRLLVGVGTDIRRDLMDCRYQPS